MLRLVTGLFLLAFTLPALADDTTFSVLVWNISDDAFVREPDVFDAVMDWKEVDIVLLDEVIPESNPESLADRLGSDDRRWNVLIGDSGGEQRQVIASPFPITPVPEFAGIVEYPEADKERLYELVPKEFFERVGRSMDGGVPVTAGIIEHGERRLLSVVVDLQCCGETPQSGQEQRRRVEARIIRERMTRVLQREDIDGVIYAGDFNLVTGSFIVSILGGPYPDPVRGLIPAEAYHEDGVSTWTWDGRGMPFPNGTLDFQFYSPSTLEMKEGLVLDTEGTSEDTLQRLGLQRDALVKTGRHRPVYVEYVWR